LYWKEKRERTRACGSHKDMTTLIFVRHGETEWNRIGRWQGHTDVPLTEEGKQQAVALAERFVDEKQHFDHVYASDLGRALETAQIVAAALGRPVHPLIELREMHLGGWSGLTSDEIRARYAADWDAFERGVDFRRGEHGESLADLRARVAAVIERLVRDHPGERLLIVTHGGTIRAAIHYVEQYTGPSPHTHIGNTSITEITVSDGRYEIVRANDHAHVALAQPVGEKQAL
jgi:broad specificity phosphatase PhoE